MLSGLFGGRGSAPLGLTELLPSAGHTLEAADGWTHGHKALGKRFDQPEPAEVRKRRCVE